MACEAINNWTFSGLVGAFLDLAIAYLLLCASTVAFFASKFLGIFGLCLPCPCNGLFGNSNQNYCAQRLLLDCPIVQVSSVQLSVKNKFPFDSVFGKDRNLDSNMVPTGDGKKNVDEFVEFEGEASCRDENGVGSGVMSSERIIDMKGKGVMNQRPKGGIRRRRKGGIGCGKLSSSTTEKHNEAISIIKEEQDEAIQGGSVPFDANRCYYEGKAPTVVKLGETAWDDFELSQPLDETKPMELKSDAHGVLGYVGDEKITIRVLKQKLEEEHAARAALYLELEEERNAAASAADEAMAMILRLQAEKASIEMEARQYQRMIEEKAAYDAEEMNILKEILLRREREKHFLEKEVEAYRQMNYAGNEQFEGDVWDTEEQHKRQFVSSLDLTEDPSLILHHLSEFIDKKERVKDRYSSNEVTSVGNFDLTCREEIPIQGGDVHADCSKQGNLERQFSHLLKCINDCNQELQEKKMISTDDDPYSQPNEGQVLENHEHKFPILSENHGQNGQNVVVEKEVRVHDVHVIDDDVNGKKIERLSSNDTSKVHRSSDVNRNSPSTSTLDAENMNRSSSEMTTGLPPMAPRGISVISDLRRNSVSELDQERLKIDSEVAWLRERLRVVQEGRGKLNLSVEYREREKLELQLLEDIVLQLREIRQSSEPGKAVRQASLPLPSSKVMLKKKRCRSASLGVDNSS